MRGSAARIAFAQLFDGPLQQETRKRRVLLPSAAGAVTDLGAFVSSSRKAGYLFGLVAYLWWGLVPLYFVALKDVPAEEILAHRIAWSILIMLGLTAITGGWATLLAALSSRKILLTMLLSGS